MHNVCQVDEQVEIVTFIPWKFLDKSAPWKENCGMPHVVVAQAVVEFGSPA
jgi:hypothetical protein